MQSQIFDYLNQFKILLYIDIKQNLQLELYGVENDTKAEIVQAILLEPFRPYHFVKKVILKKFFPKIYHKSIISILNKYDFDWITFLIAKKLKKYYQNGDLDNLLQGDIIDLNGEFKTAAENRIKAFKQHLYLVKTGFIYSIRKYPDLVIELFLSDPASCRAFATYTGMTISHLNVEHDERIGTVLKHVVEPEIPDWVIQNLIELDKG